MARRGRASEIASLIEGFNSGYGLVGGVMRDNDLRKVADAKVEQVAVAPPADADPSAPQTPSVRYTLAGQDLGAAAPDDAAIGRGRQLAMAGVLEKHGDIERAGRLRDRVEAGDDRAEARRLARKGEERGDLMFDWQKADRAAAEKLRKREEDYTAGRQAAFNNSTFGQRNAAYAKAVDQYQKDKAAYDARLEAGDRSMPEPQMPARPTVGVGEALLDHATLLAHDIAYGKADSAAMVKFAELQKQVNDEGYTKSLKLAQGGAPLTQVIAQFNAAGNVKLDPAAVLSDKMVDRGNGVKSRVITIKREDGGTQVIDTLAELDAMDKADKVFTRAYQANAEGRADRADRRAGAAEGRAADLFKEGLPARQVAGQVAGLQAELLKPETTAARRTEIQGLLAGLSAGQGDANAPAEVKLAQAAIRAGLHKDMKDALVWARTTKDKSASETRADLYTAFAKSLTSPQAAAKATDEAMAYLDKAGQAPAPAGPPKGAIVDGHEFLGGDPKDAKNWRPAPSRSASGTVK